MATSAQPCPVIHYPAEDHDTWHKLCLNQLELVREVAHPDFHAGFPKLGLDFTRIPDPNLISARLQELTGWTLVDAENKFLDAEKWFHHLASRRFPVTNYIRRPHELAFSELPDLFHEYFGHLSLFARPTIADLSQYFGTIALKAKTDKQILDVARIWWFIFEVGFVRHGDGLKVIGGALLSSPGELKHAIRPEIPKYPFTIEHVTQTPGMYYTYHDFYFYLESLEQIHDILDEYVRREGLDL